MRLWPKVVSEQKVRRELQRNGGTYSVTLRSADTAWNPDPEDAFKRLASGSMFAGPFTVTYKIGKGGHVTASLRRW